MKPVCCDTSFLFALYGNDVHTTKALSQVRGMSGPLTLSVLNAFELGNALRFASWREVFSARQVAQSLSAFELDCQAGRLIITAYNLAAVVNEAQRLSSRHTLAGGHRSFDILHVAAALQGQAGVFLSFDINQRKLARAEGLKVLP